MKLILFILNAVHDEESPMNLGGIYEVNAHHSTNPLSRVHKHNYTYERESSQDSLACLGVESEIIHADELHARNVQ